MPWLCIIIHECTKWFSFTINRVGKMSFFRFNLRQSCPGSLSMYLVQYGGWVKVRVKFSQWLALSISHRMFRWSSSSWSRVQCYWVSVGWMNKFVQMMHPKSQQKREDSMVKAWWEIPIFAIQKYITLIKITVHKIKFSPLMTELLTIVKYCFFHTEYFSAIFISDDFLWETKFEGAIT